MKKYWQFPWYPFLFSLYPALTLMAHNISQVQYAAGIRSLLVSCIGTILFTLVFRLIYRNWHRAAFIATAWVLLFFTYGQVYDVVNAKWKPVYLSNWMLAIWLCLFIIVLALAGLRKARFESAVLPLNVVSFGLLIYPLFLVVRWENVHSNPVQGKALGPEPALHISSDATLPDIYYIMPEDYGRVDLLQSMDQIDISQFMEYLKNSGFYIGDCSQSNYAMESELSLGSALNMEYLQNLSPKFTPNNLDQGPIWNAIRYSAVSADLKKVGYKTVAYATGFAWSELTNSDVYFAPSLLWSDLTSFEIQLLRTTPIRRLEDIGVLNLNEIDGERYRERTMLDFNSAATLASMPGPKFVFMHIISPHEPFVFGPDGKPIDPAPFMDQNQLYTQEQYIRGYRLAVPFVNMELEKTITTLITKSTRPLVIILQTDTGPMFTTGSDMFKILNAYYMPGHTGQLYPSISPVNSFRVVFNAYFGTDLPLLNDASYFSPIPQIYDFSPVPNPCSGK
jgi:hypothetical protein